MPALPITSTFQPRASNDPRSIPQARRPSLVHLRALEAKARALASEPTRILQPGSNCWCVAHAHRVAWLIDAQAYFSAFREAAKRASSSILIVAWDIDSRTPLLAEDPQDGWPVVLGEFLHALVQRKRSLRVYILDWDFAMLYQTDRELLPAHALGWRKHRRLRFQFDGEHPVGGSHHQKIAVVDDRIAFAGGLDLTSARWDTCAHLPGDTRRTSPRGAYAPFHDVQMMVDGDAAAALGHLARERWRRITGRNPRSVGTVDATDPWPLNVAPSLYDVPVGIARTQPELNGIAPVQEVKRLYLDAIAAARHGIYIENQYLTAPAVVDALAARLAQRDGPEVVIVSRLRGGGWLEESTMTVLRVHMLRTLRAADAHGRLRVYYPHQEGLGEQCINVHSKLMIVDDRFARIGSANLNNRSMGYDTECDLAIEASEPRVAVEIAHLRNRLLAEHLDVDPESVERSIDAARGSLVAGIEALRGRPRTLMPLEPDPDTDPLLIDAAVIDPERPLPADELATQFVPADHRPHAARRVVFGALLLIAVAALAAAWKWTPLREMLDLDALSVAVAALRDAPLAPVLVLGAYVVASTIALPITLMIIATALVFGPLSALAYALGGSLLGAGFTYWLGRSLGQDLVRRVAGPRLTRLSRKLAQRGLLAIVAMRIIPVAPFTVVNLAAGATLVSPRDFLLGTFIGMLPGITGITLFSDRVVAALREPSGITLAALAAASALIVAVALLLRNWLARRTARTAAAARAH